MKKDFKMEDELRNKLLSVTKTIQEKEFLGESQGVEVYALGTSEIISVHIKDSILENKDLLQESLIIAINDCLSKINDAHKNLLSSVMNSAASGILGE